MQSPNERTEGLIAEIERYLRAVETFRREGCEPSWRREGPPAMKSTRKELRC